MEDKKFESVVENLMAGNIICQTAFPMEFDFLSNSYNRTTVDDYIRRIGRSLAQTSDNLGFLMVYSSLDSSDKAKRSKAFFKTIEQDLSPLVDWMRLARNANDQSNPVAAGELLNESELLAAIESSRPLAEQLTSISNRLGRAVKSREIKTKLASVLTYLVDNGYFVRRSNTGSIYEATAKWSFVYDAIEFYVQRQSPEECEGYPNPHGSKDSQQSLEF